MDEHPAGEAVWDGSSEALLETTAATEDNDCGDDSCGAESVVELSLDRGLHAMSEEVVAVEGLLD